MLFTNDNKILYSVEINGDGTCDMYNFRTMYHNPTAIYALLQVEFPQVGAIEGYLKTPFVLTLEFYNNIRNPNIDNLINKFTSLLNERELNFKIEENPLKIIVVDIEINDICMLIDLHEFQLLCIQLSIVSSWHLFGTH
jgi:hypothetical protein